MTDSDLTHLTLVLDRSGSMHGLVNDMEPAIQQLLDDQAALPGRLLIDVVTFDTIVERPYTNAVRGEIKSPLIDPRGGTALLDAVGMTIHSLGERYAHMPEDKRPGTVVVAVVTDGMENSSREYTQPQVKAMVEHQQSAYQWTITFLGANMDAVAVGSGLGVPVAASMTYDASSAGVSASFAAASQSMSGLRTTGSFGYTDQQRSTASGINVPNAANVTIMNNVPDGVIPGDKTVPGSKKNLFRKGKK